MKDIKHCSIAHTAFTLEIDAYETLHNYIESIRARYNNSAEGEEIIADIEARIAELILSAHSANRVVAKPLIDNIIAQMGSVDDICDDSTDGDASGEQREEQPKSKRKRRLYRNIDDAPIGGVCSGLAAYLGCDTAVVRIATLLLILFGGLSVAVYIILWIAMPAAITSSQKLEMRGEPITASSIRDFYDSTVQSTKNQSVISSLLRGIGRLMMIIFKIIMILILVALILAMIAVVMAIIAVIVVHGAAHWNEYAIFVLALSSIAALLFMGIYVAQQLINSSQIKSSTLLIALVVWLLLSLTAATVGMIDHDNINSKIENIELFFDSASF